MLIKLKLATYVVKLVHNWVEASVSFAFIIGYFVQQKPVVLCLPQITSWRPHWLQRNRVCVSAKAPPHLKMLEDSSALCDLSPVETVDAHCIVRIVFRHEPQCLVWTFDRFLYFIIWFFPKNDIFLVVNILNFKKSFMFEISCKIYIKQINKLLIVLKLCN